jgi:glycosyltransferase involved in cell wall biosynthesis
MDNPVPLHIYGGFGAPCGYRTHTLSFARALARIHPVRLRLLGERLEPSSLPDDLQGLLEQNQDTLPDIALYIGGMHDFPRLPGRFRIGYAVFETTRLPERLLRAFDGLDQIWVPTTWCRAQLIHNRIDPARIRIVPEGVDTDSYSPAPERRAGDATPFRFLCVGKWETRKCQEELIRTFVRTFGPHENVELIIHGHNPFVPGFSLEDAITRARGRARHRIIASPPLSEAELVDLYRRCDALVLPTRGEAWGLPITEAMACALPVIATAHGGPLDFLHDDHAYPLPVSRLRRVRDRSNFRPGRHFGRWAEPDWKALASIMRHVVEHPLQARAVGARARRYAEQHLTWHHAAEKAARVLKDLSSTAP